LRLLALVFEFPREGWQEQLDALAEECGAADLIEMAQRAREEASPELYHTTFGPGGPAAPREVSYAGAVLPGPLLADVQAFYEAFAYRPALDEPPDHVAVELGFLSYLHLKAAYAASRDDHEQAAVAAEAAKRFTDTHLANLLGPLARILEASGIGYLQAAAAALRQGANLGSLT
jgi:nitrate reductase assembly molybdenum cofactor insertion protein NarJ